MGLAERFVCHFGWRFCGLLLHSDCLNYGPPSVLENPSVTRPKTNSMSILKLEGNTFACRSSSINSNNLFPGVMSQIQTVHTIALASRDVWLAGGCNGCRKRGHLACNEREQPTYAIQID